MAWRDLFNRATAAEAARLNKWQGACLCIYFPKTVNPHG